MNNKQFLILLAFSLLPFFFLLLRGEPVGVDGFAYASNVLYGTPLPDKPLVFSWVVEALPASLTAIHLLLWLCFFVHIFFLAKLGELFNKEHGWIAGLFAFMAVSFTLISFEFEPVAFALPLISLGFWLFFKGELKKPGFFSLSVEKIAGLGVLVFTGAFVWTGAALAIAALAASFILALLVAIPIFVLRWQNFASAVLPNALVAENRFLVGLLNPLLLNVGWIALPQALLYPTLILGFFAVLSSKFSTLLIPFLSVGAVGLFARLPEKALTKFFGKMVEVEWKNTFLIIAVIVAIGFSFALLYHFPRENQKLAVQYALDLNASSGKPLENDWDLGYYVRFYSKGRVLPEHYGFGNIDLQDFNDSIAVTRRGLDCKLLKTFQDLNVFDC